MDLNREPFSFNSTVNIELRIVSKRANREVLVRKFGEDFYQALLQSPLPFVAPSARGAYTVIVFIFV